eukprot:523907_1
MKVILTFQALLFVILIPILFFIFNHKQILIIYITNGLIIFLVIQLFVISMLYSSKKLNVFKIPEMCHYCTSRIFWLFICILSMILIIIQAVTVCIFMETSIIWREIDTFGGFCVLWLMLILSLGFSSIPSSMFSNFWKKEIFENFSFLDLECLQTLYAANRIEQKHSGLLNKFISLKSNIIAPWIHDYKPITHKHNSYKLCNDLLLGIRTTTYIHFEYKLKQISFWKKICSCFNKPNIIKQDICYYYEIDNKTQNGAGKTSNVMEDDNKYNNESKQDNDMNCQSLQINQNHLKFIEYFPTKFANIRAWNGITNNLYLETFTSNLLEFVTNSKSGMYFFYTFDGKFLIKSLKKSEFVFFQNIFNDYYRYLKENRNTLINKFFGCYSIKYKGKIIYFMVMECIFYGNLNIDSIYDLKGSTKNRIATASDKRKSKVPVLKDLDWKKNNKRIDIGTIPSRLYKKQLKKDIDFLAGLNIMDFSLLIGSCCRNKNENVKYKLNDYNFKNGINSPYLFTNCHRGLISFDKNCIYFSGIIDILQKFTKKKKAENIVKRIKSKQNQISCVPPQFY